MGFLFSANAYAFITMIKGMYKIFLLEILRGCPKVLQNTLLDWAESGLLILMLEKLNWFCLTSLITLVLLM